MLRTGPAVQSVLQCQQLSSVRVVTEKARPCHELVHVKFLDSSSRLSTGPFRILPSTTHVIKTWTESGQIFSENCVFFHKP